MLTVGIGFFLMASIIWVGWVIMRSMFSGRSKLLNMQHESKERQQSDFGKSLSNSKQVQLHASAHADPLVSLMVDQVFKEIDSNRVHSQLDENATKRLIEAASKLRKMFEMQPGLEQDEVNLPFLCMTKDNRPYHFLMIVHRHQVNLNGHAL